MTIVAIGGKRGGGGTTEGGVGVVQLSGDGKGLVIPGVRSLKE